MTVGGGAALPALMPQASPEQSVVGAAGRGTARQPPPWQAGAGAPRLRLGVGVGWRI